jgi:hypothetical protein
MAAVTLAGIDVIVVVVYVVPIVLPMFATTAVCVTTVVLLLVSLPSAFFKILYIFCCTYPCWTTALHNWMDVRHLEFASLMNIFRIGYGLTSIASHVSNSFIASSRKKLAVRMMDSSWPRVL